MPTNKQSAKYWKWCGSQQKYQIKLQNYKQSIIVDDDGDEDMNGNMK